MNFFSIAAPGRARRACARRPSRSRARGDAGFSLLEMTIVVAILMIAGAIALLMAQQVVRSVHLQTAASNYANLLQQARVRAVQDDNYYSVVIVAPNGNGSYTAFIDIGQNGTLAGTDPQLLLPADVKSKDISSAPAVSNLESQFLPANTSSTVNTTAEGPTFSPRGIPCTPSSTSGGSCPSLYPPTSYITFLKNVRSSNWEAITVSPAGRIRLWSYDGSGNWQPMN